MTGEAANTKEVLTGPHQAESTGNFSKYKLDKTVAGGMGKNKYPASQSKVCAAHTT